MKTFEIVKNGVDGQPTKLSVISNKRSSHLLIGTLRDTLMLANLTPADLRNLADAFKKAADEREGE